MENTEMLPATVPACPRGPEFPWFDTNKNWPLGSIANPIAVGLGEFALAGKLTMVHFVFEEGQGTVTVPSELTLYTVIESSPKFATNSNDPSGVNAIAEGFGPVWAVDLTDDTDPLLRSMVSELRVRSPVVATHIKPVPNVCELLSVEEQLLNSKSAAPATSARTQVRMRILLLKTADLLDA